MLQIKEKINPKMMNSQKTEFSRLRSSDASQGRVGILSTIQLINH